MFCSCPTFRVAASTTASLCASAMTFDLESSHTIHEKNYERAVTITYSLPRFHPTKIFLMPLDASVNLRDVTLNGLQLFDLSQHNY